MSIWPVSRWNFEWPAWVPDAIRREVERFWAGNDQDWTENAKVNNAPEMGSIVSLRKLCCEELVEGRFVFAWNNIGRVVYEDGTFEYVAFESPQDDILRHL